MTQQLETSTRVVLNASLSSARNVLITAEASLGQRFDSNYDSANALIVDVSAISGTTNTYDLFTVGLDDPLGDNVTMSGLDWLFISNEGSDVMTIPHTSALSAIPLVANPLTGQNIRILPGNFGFWNFSNSALPVTLAQGKISISGTSGQSYNLMIAGRN